MIILIIYHCKKHSERFGIDAHHMALSETIKYFNYPCLIVHDDKDKEMLYDYAVNSSKNIPEKFQNIFLYYFLFALCAGAPSYR